MIRLGKFDQAGYDRLISWVPGPEYLIQFAGRGFTFPLTWEQLDKLASDKNMHAFEVEIIETKTPIGHGEIYQTGNAAYLCRIIIGEKKCRERGLGQQLVSQLLSYAFNKLKVEEISLNVFDNNESAIHCYQIAGFYFTGRKTEREINGQKWMALNMAINRQNMI